MTEEPQPLTVMMEVHRELDDELLVFLDALIERRYEAAKAALETYRRDLLLHMKDEEELILPLYAERVPRQPGRGIELFLEEHRKLRAMMEALPDELSRASESPEPRPRAILPLLDEAYLFRSLLLHHDLRERNFLYPLLDQALTPEERQELLGRVGRPPVALAGRSGARP